jgi:hypothetical protein
MYIQGLYYSVFTAVGFLKLSTHYSLTPYVVYARANKNKDYEIIMKYSAIINMTVNLASGTKKHFQ